MNQFRFVIILLCFGFWGQAKGARLCQPHIIYKSKDHAAISEVIVDVIRHELPALCDETIRLKDLNSRTDFFHANTSIWRLVLLGDKSHWRIRINPLIIESPPSDLALKAILVHELNHLNDYLKMSPGELRSFGWHYWVSHDFRRDYERRVDYKTVAMGHRQGLYEFRLWLKDQLTAKQWQKKVSYYLTPDELAE